MKRVIGYGVINEAGEWVVTAGGTVQHKIMNLAEAAHWMSKAPNPDKLHLVEVREVEPIPLRDEPQS